MRDSVKPPVTCRQTAPAWVTVFLVLTVGLGMGGLATPRMEIFPFFSWFLFAKTPQPEARFELRIHQLNGKDLDPPWRDTNFRSIDLFRLTQRLGKAHQSGHMEEVAHARRLIERQFLTPPTRYEIWLAEPTDGEAEENSSKRAAFNNPLP